MSKDYLMIYQTYTCSCKFWQGCFGNGDANSSSPNPEDGLGNLASPTQSEMAVQELPNQPTEDHRIEFSEPLTVDVTMVLWVAEWIIRVRREELERLRDVEFQHQEPSNGVCADDASLIQTRPPSSSSQILQQTDHIINVVPQEPSNGISAENVSLNQTQPPSSSSQFLQQNNYINNVVPQGGLDLTWAAIGYCLSGGFTFNEILAQVGDSNNVSPRIVLMSFLLKIALCLLITSMIFARTNPNMAAVVNQFGIAIVLISAIIGAMPTVPLYVSIGCAVIMIIVFLVHRLCFRKNNNL